MDESCDIILIQWSGEEGLCWVQSCSMKNMWMCRLDASWRNLEMKCRLAGIVVEVVEPGLSFPPRAPHRSGMPSGAQRLASPAGKRLLVIRK